jgi:mono/diheme cytochrome c family protein
MKNTKYLFSIIILFSILLLTGCISLAEDITPPPGMVAPSPPLDTPEPQPTTAPLSFQFDLEPPDTNLGSAIFQEKCAPCHGGSGLGDGVDSALLQNDVPALGSVELARSSTPTEWYTIVTQGNMEEFMPPFSSLSDQERWNVVAYLYTLSVPEEIILQGESMFLENCAQCHGQDGRQGVTDLTNLSIMGERSVEDFFNMISTGHELMPAFDELSVEDRWVLADYLRSLPFTPLQENIEIEVTEVGGETSDLDAQSDPETELSIEDSNLEPGNGNVNVTVVNSFDSILPPDLDITLRGYDEMVEVYTQTLTLTDGIEITFEDIPLPVGRMYFATIDHGYAVYGSDIATIDGSLAELDLEIAYYTPTSDQSILHVDRMHIFIDFVNETTLEIYHLYIFSNPSERVLVPEEDGDIAVNFIIPPNSSELYVEENMSLAFQKTEVGFGVANIYPNPDPYQVVFSYQIPYEGKKLDLSIPVSLDAQALILMAPADGFKVKGDKLEDAGTQDFEGVAYSMFTSSSLIAGNSIELNLSGRPEMNAPIISTGEGTSTSLVIGVAALGLALIAVGIYMWRRNQVEDGDWDDDFEDQTPEDLMDAINALDDQYKTGGLPEGAYRQRRAELKELLRELVQPGT